MKYTLETRDSGVTRWEYKPVEEPDVDYDSTSDIDESTPVRISNHLSCDKADRYGSQRHTAFAIEKDG